MYFSMIITEYHMEVSVSFLYKYNLFEIFGLGDDNSI